MINDQSLGGRYGGKERRKERMELKEGGGVAAAQNWLQGFWQLICIAVYASYVRLISKSLALT